MYFFPVHSFMQAFLVPVFLVSLFKLKKNSMCHVGNIESEKVFFAFVLGFYKWLKYYSTKKHYLKTEFHWFLL